MMAILSCMERFSAIVSSIAARSKNICSLAEALYSGFCHSTTVEAEAFSSLSVLGLAVVFPLPRPPLSTPGEAALGVPGFVSFFLASFPLVGGEASASVKRGASASFLVSVIALSRSSVAEAGFATSSRVGNPCV